MNIISDDNKHIDDKNMNVIKRDGSIEEMKFDKILTRIKNIGSSCNITNINYTILALKVIEQLHDNITTKQIDELLAEQCETMATKHLDYLKLANKTIISSHQKNIKSSFTDAMYSLYNFIDVKGNNYPLIDKDLKEFCDQYKDWIDNVIDYSRDFLIEYFGYKTLEKSYLLKIHGSPVERIQHLWMRVSIGIHYTFFCKKRDYITKHVKSDLTDSEKKLLDFILFELETNMLDDVKDTYDLMSQKYFIHATPTLFNAGTTLPQLSSCFLIALEEDSIAGIYDTLKDAALISKYSGGIGLHIHNVRSKGAHIRSTNGISNGIVPMLRVFNNSAKYVDQGGGKRSGSIAVYLEPHHPDVEDFLEMKKNHGDEDSKARDLFYALWISDLFMERVQAKEKWSLFCPVECPGLCDVWGDEYRALYLKYESEGKAKKTINALDLWFQILKAQMETGTPYLLYKDACNKKSNQKNIGTIKSSNLCTEIIQYSDKNETAVCNLASIALPSFVDETTKTFDYEKLHKITKIITKNLNKVIDINFYPTEKTRLSNFRHRPIGIGVQGLADTFILLGLEYCCEESNKINKAIFETIYHAALEASMEEARNNYIFYKNIRPFFKEDPVPRYFNTGDAPWYSTYEGSPISKGIFQFDMWGVVPDSGRYDWDELKGKIGKWGVVNSLLVAPMPTASTSQILGFNECIEPITNNIYTRRTLAGEFIVINKYLLKELIDLGVWTESLKNNIVENKGSIQHLPDEIVPQYIKNKYKTVWEMSMKNIINMSADRGAFICQSQSLNLWIEDPTLNVLTSMHFYGWKRGLKTGIYYLRRKAKHQAQQFTIEPKKLDSSNDMNESEEICEMCSA